MRRRRDTPKIAGSHPRRGAPLEEVSSQIIFTAEGLHVITYPVILDVPRELAGLLADERRARGTRTGTRSVSCGKQALFALMWFRERRER